MAKYNQLMYLLAQHDLDWVNDDIRVLLVTSSYTFNADHDSLSDVTNELSGGGYARQSLTNKSVEPVDGSDLVNLKADDVTFSSLITGTSGVPAGAIVFKHNATASLARLLGYFTDGLPVTTSPGGNDVILDWGTNTQVVFRLQ
jgi:acyl-CoA synthetase (AMP-forming)/AMP-acid ligase II